VLALGAAGACRPLSRPGNVAKTPLSAPVAVESSAHKSPAEIAAKATPAIVSVRTETSLGAGFVVDKSGLVASNMHVIAGSAKVVVTLADKREYPVKQLTNGDREHDLVIMQIDAKDLPVLVLGDSDAMRPGDPVVAIGHPMGLADTVSNGLVSAVRKIDDNLTVLQISAPIAQGSSGGPIFNDRGEVIGVATAIFAGGQNLNFGMPVNYVKLLLKTRDPVPIDVFAAATAHFDSPDGGRARPIPAFPAGILDGCGDASLALIVKTIGGAIQVGAPLFNEGNFIGCYMVYVGAAADLETKLPGGCRHAAKALEKARRKAQRLKDSSDQAWVLRDVFDGLLEAVGKRAVRHARPKAGR
jgi:serine protease Do